MKCIFILPFLDEKSVTWLDRDCPPRMPIGIRPWLYGSLFSQTNCFSWYSSRQRTVATIPVKLITHTEVRHWLSSHTELACARPKRWRDGDCACVKWRNIYRWMLTLSCAHQNGSQLDLAYCIWKQVFRRQDNNVKIRCFAVHCQGLKKNYMIQTIFFFLWHSPFGPLIRTETELNKVLSVW